ncbi:MAG: zinc ribbon domain-containing protein [Chloroflexota bacterium]|nr:zinc ribbon domain-containing protein [Chloroflexota bacterium]MDQ5867608.1 zinc ribbon domain-containing protein [Chloroflexota bacterium]
MELETLNCNHCGAPLRVPESANFVTCAHCGSQLAVKRTDTAHYTEVLTRLDARTTEMAQELQELKLQNELNAIDDAWEEERQRYMISPSRGAPYLPDDEHVTRDIMGHTLMGVILIFALCLVASEVSTRDFGWIIVVFGVAILAVGGFGVGSTLLKAREYRQAEQAYRARLQAVRQRHGARSVHSDLSGLVDGNQSDETDPRLD